MEFTREMLNPERLNFVLLQYFQPTLRSQLFRRHTWVGILTLDCVGR
jgi:hypothetical protein